MKLIKKGSEPKSLKEYRESTPNPVYSPTDDIRKSLLSEQGYICAYCMRRISLHRTKGKGTKPKIEIEHFKSQHRYNKGKDFEESPNLTLTYKNMLGVCNGNAGKAEHKLCCDKSKSSFDKTHDLTVNPLEVDRIKQIKYAKNGEVFSEIKPVDFDLKMVLNLNEPNLKIERANLISNLKKRIKLLILQN